MCRVGLKLRLRLRLRVRVRLRLRVRIRVRVRLRLMLRLRLRVQSLIIHCSDHLIRRGTMVLRRLLSMRLMGQGDVL